MNVIDDRFCYCSCHDESIGKKWAKKKIMDNLKEMRNNMGETRYTRQKGIELNEENLPKICKELIGYNYVLNLEADKVNKVLKVIPPEGCNRSFKFGEYLQMNKYGLRAVPTDREEYTACWLYKQGVHQKLFYADNVTSYSIDKKYGQIQVYTKEKGYVMDMSCGVIVFDDNGDFVEVFKTDAPSLDFAMVEHGYKKVK